MKSLPTVIFRAGEKTRNTRGSRLERKTNNRDGKRRKRHIWREEGKGGNARQKGQTLHCRLPQLPVLTIEEI